MLEGIARIAPDSVAPRAALGLIAARQGDRAAALRISASLDGMARPYLFGQIPYWQARIAAVLGQREQAVTLLRRAFAEGREFGLDDHVDPDLRLLRDDPAYLELIRPRG